MTGLNVKDFGAVGNANYYSPSNERWYADSSYTQHAHDDTAAIQAAFDAANGEREVYFPASSGRYLVSRTVVNPAGKPLYLRGETIEVTIQAADGLAGYLIRVSAAPTVEKLTFRGNSKDGVFCFGGTEGNFQGLHLAQLRLYDAEYGLKFDGTAEFPVRAQLQDIWCFNMRTGGIKFATDQTPQSGQSCFSVDNVVTINMHTRGIPANNLVVTDNVTPTTDLITWSHDGAREYGWIFMRRRANASEGREGQNSWEHIGSVAAGTVSITAHKQAGERWEYTILRHTVGAFFKHIKALQIGVLQSEYMGTGIRLQNCTGGSLSSFYYEWRGNYDGLFPIPRGNALQFLDCNGFSIQSGWADFAMSAIEVVSSRQISIHGVVASDCGRSAVHLRQQSSNQSVYLGKIYIRGITPTKITVTPTTFNHNYISLNPYVDESIESEFVVNHHRSARQSAYYRGIRKASIVANIDGGHIEGSTLDMMRESKKLTRTLSVANSVNTLLVQNMPTEFMSFAIDYNSYGSLMIHYTVRCRNQYDVTRQVVSGLLNISCLRSLGDPPVVEVLAANEVKSLGTGTLELQFSSESRSDGTVVLKATSNSSLTMNATTLYIVPVVVVGGISDLVQI